MEIHRYLRTDRPDKSDRYQVRLVLHAHNFRLQISTGEKVSINGWDEKKQRAKGGKGGEPYYLRINNRLDNQDDILSFVFHQLRDLAEPLTKDNLKAGYEAVLKFVDASGEKEVYEKLLNAAWEAYLNPPLPEPETSDEAGPERADFIKLMGLWIEDEKRRINMRTGRKRSPNTIKSFNSSLNKIKEYQEFSKQPLTLMGMTSAFYKDFQSFMLDEKEHEVNYFGKVVGHLTQFLGWCENEHDLEVHRHYRKFETPSIYVGVDFLLLDEFKAIKNLDFQSHEIRKKLEAGYSNKLKEDLRAKAFDEYVQRVELARDIFLMCCYTGLRISDCQNFSKIWISGELLTVADTTKTAVTCYIPYFNDDLFEPKSLVQKYAGESNQVFPNCPTINKHLKTVQKLAKVERFPLTTKIGRKTFVTMKTYQGVPVALIMQATGHQSEKDFRRYLGVDSKELVEAFKSRSLKLVSGVGAEMGAEKVNIAMPA